MDLKRYIFDKGLTISQVARDLDITINYFGRIVRGQYKPSKRLARDISIYTQGAVSAEELLCQ